MISAIIVAGGSGERMQERLRKQYLEISGVPILSYTLLAVDSCSLIDHIILVVPKGDLDYCDKNIISPFRFQNKIHLVEGGAKRCDSVFNGLTAIDKNTRIVVIHDGVRPFVQSEQIEVCIKTAQISGACILGAPVYDTLKRIDNSEQILETIEREKVRFAQTPQAFKYELILKAHKDARKDGFVGSDDAQLVERIGEKVKVINGSRWNIKITSKEDLFMAQSLLKNNILKKTNREFMFKK